MIWSECQPTPFYCLPDTIATYTVVGTELNTIPHAVSDSHILNRNFAAVSKDHGSASNAAPRAFDRGACALLAWVAFGAVEVPRRIVFEEAQSLYRAPVVKYEAVMD